MTVDVEITSTAQQQRKMLRNKHAKHFEQWLEKLKRDGCRALQYRLTGDLVERLCVRHLTGPLRVIVAFHSAEHATIVLIGPHDDGDPGIDVYRHLYSLAGIETPSARTRTKPPCCDEEGHPPSDDEEIIDLVQRAQRLRRRRTG
ncbi:hypothetical protein [Actinopolyspora alba]|nr:hypothetical protein [Actinopolyspora alba]